MSSPADSMNPTERRASMGLASIYGLRMLGLFIILPIFSIYADKTLHADHTLTGIAIGAYGLTQAILQIPMGWASDRFGRKPVIYFSLLLFAIGSLVAATHADDIYWLIAGRAIQGAGALNAAVMALAADLTREEHRTKAMATIGITIGIAFSISMVISPLLYSQIGMNGIFVLTGALALAAMAVVAFVIPNPQITRFHTDTEASRKKIGEVLRHPQLLRMDFSIFALHAILMSVFVQVPFVLEKFAATANVEQHWKVYLPVMLIAFILMVPPIIVAEKKAKMKQVFMASIGLALLAQLALMALQSSIWGIAFALLVFFTAFNVLEATLPSLISKIAPLSAKGTAMGVYSSSQFFGAFFGAAIGGYTLAHWGGNAVFYFAITLLALWLLVALGIKPPAAVRTKMFHVAELDTARASALQHKLEQVSGVREALVVGTESMVCLKTDMQGYDEAAVENLIRGA
jgi:MFS family permease